MQEVTSVLDVIRTTQDFISITRGLLIAPTKIRTGQLFPTGSITRIVGVGLPWEQELFYDAGGTPTHGTTGGFPYFQMNSDDDSGDDAYISTNEDAGQNPASLPMLRFKFSLNHLTVLRMWHGFFDSDGPDVITADDPDGDYAAIRYSTNASDTTWKYITSANDTSTVTDSGIAPVADQIYHIEIEFESAGVRFRIEDENKAVLNEQTVTTNRPRDNVVGLQMCNGLETLEAVTKSWRLYYAEMFAKIG